jgi:hypothetical protein
MEPLELWGRISLRNLLNDEWWWDRVKMKRQWDKHKAKQCREVLTSNGEEGKSSQPLNSGLGSGPAERNNLAIMIDPIILRHSLNGGSPIALWCENIGSNFWTGGRRNQSAFVLGTSPCTQWKWSSKASGVVGTALSQSTGDALLSCPQAKGNYLHWDGRACLATPWARGSKWILVCPFTVTFFWGYPGKVCCCHARSPRFPHRISLWTVHSIQDTVCSRLFCNKLILWSTMVLLMGK